MFISFFYFKKLYNLNVFKGKFLTKKEVRVFETDYLIGLGYFLIGFVLAIIDVWSIESYLMYGSIIGGIATISSLLSFVKPSITTDDLANPEIKTLKNIFKKK